MSPLAPFEVAILSTFVFFWDQLTQISPILRPYLLRLVSADVRNGGRAGLHKAQAKPLYKPPQIWTSGQVDKWNKQANVSEFRHPMHTAAVPKEGKICKLEVGQVCKKKYVAAIREGGR